MKYSAIIVANGSGSRMNLGFNKVYAKLKDKKTIIRHSLNLFMLDKDCTEIIVVSSPSDFHASWQEYWPGKIVLVRGGATRQESVYEGLFIAKEDYVLIHDGARPYLEEKELEAIKASLKNHDACVLCVPCKDTIKRVKDNNIEETYPREELYAAQTPQAFERNLFLKCFDKAIEDNYIGTDDSSLVERYGKTKVKMIVGSYRNIKITTEDDLD